MSTQAQALKPKSEIISAEELRERFKTPLAIFRHPTGRWGLIIVLAMCMIALLASTLAPYDPNNIELRGPRGQAPSLEHLFGTDGSGVDVFSAVIYGSRVSLIIGLATAVLISLAGAMAGIAAGYLGGWVDTILMRAADCLMAIPALPLMIILAAYLGTQFWVIIFIFVLLGWAGVARVVRAQVLSVSHRAYVESAIVSGASTWRVMWNHILPAVSSLVIVNGVLLSSGMIIAEAGLSFLGFGDPHAVSWGKMLSAAQTGNAIILGLWWWIVAPGAAIFITTMGFLFVGYALEEVMNPYMKGR